MTNHNYYYKSCSFNLYDYEQSDLETLRNLIYSSQDKLQYISYEIFEFDALGMHNDYKKGLLKVIYIYIYECYNILYLLSVFHFIFFIYFF